MTHTVEKFDAEKFKTRWPAFSQSETGRALLAHQHELATDPKYRREYKARLDRIMPVAGAPKPVAAVAASKPKRAPKPPDARASIARLRASFPNDAAAQAAATELEAGMILGRLLEPSEKRICQETGTDPRAFAETKRARMQAGAQ